jgi:PadR family transcriptional regulator, regulatory protein PadR
MPSARKTSPADANQCPCSGATLDRLIQPAILAVLAEGPLHGYRIADRIGDLPGFEGERPDLSGIYRFLKAMERHGMVCSGWDISAPGPAKKSYRITADGQLCLKRWVKTLESYRKNITSLLKATRKASRR